MANLCYFNLKVVGNLKNLDKFKKILTAKYNYNKTIPCETNHFFNIFNVYKIEEENNYDIYSGECSWSIYNCMLDKSNSSNYTQLKRDYSSFMGVTLDEVSKNLNLKIEVFSEETSFMEHIIVDNGNIILNDYIELDEKYVEEIDQYITVNKIEWKFKI